MYTNISGKTSFGAHNDSQKKAVNPEAGQKVHLGTHLGKDPNEILGQPNILFNELSEMGYMKGIFLCKGMFGSSNMV